MKRPVFLFTLLFALFMGPVAWAEMQEFKYFKADVPAGWKAETVDEHTVSIVSQDASCVVTTTVAPKGGKSIHSIARETGDRFKAKMEKDADGDWTFAFKNENGVDGFGILSEEDGNMILITVVGAHEDLVTILNSME